MDPKIIVGNNHMDSRGTIQFVNEFDMSAVKRFYVITHPDVEISRGWRAHRIEQRWFHVINGIFNIRLVRIYDWVSPKKKVEILEYRLKSSDTVVLHVPSGYASSIQAIEANSKLVVFGDYGIESAANDDYIYPSDYFLSNKE